MNNIRALRTEMNLSQQQLADELHVSQQSIHKYETEVSDPDINMLIAMAEFFDTSVDYLIGITDNRNKPESDQPDITKIKEYCNMTCSEKKKKILIIDAQGGGIGKQLITGIKSAVPEAIITAVGTNTTATSNMLKAGADTAATGENAVIVGCRKNDYIIGPMGIVIADSMNGEITPAMSVAVAQSEAVRILIPFNHCDTYIAGTPGKGTGILVKEAIDYLKNRL